MSDLTNLVVVGFTDESKAYQAYSELKEAAAQGRVGVVSAALVQRDIHGVLRVPEGADLEGGDRTMGGGLVGMLVGVIGGPLGMLLGWGTGALIGGAFDLRRSDRGDAVMTQISASIPPGTTSLLAEVDEVATEVVDGLMIRLGGVVVRRPAAAVLAELEAAEDAADAAAAEADKALREQKKAQRHAKYEDRKAALQSKFSRHHDS